MVLTKKHKIYPNLYQLTVKYMSCLLLLYIYGYTSILYINTCGFLYWNFLSFDPISKPKRIVKPLRKS